MEPKTNIMYSKKILIVVAMFFSVAAFCQPCTTPPTINFSFNSIHLCPGEIGTNNALISGGVGPITYNWSDGSSTSSITFSATDTTWYYLEITDDCFTVLDSFKVYLHDVNISSLSITDATNCPGQPGILGSLQAFPNNPTYLYTLYGGGNTYGPQISNSFSNLSGGVIYFLHVEDPYDCYADSAVTIGLGANATTATWDIGLLEPVTCFGDNDGTASVSNVGGGITAPYDVTWTHISGISSQTTMISAGGGDLNSNLIGGDWVVTVTDQEGCAWSNLFEIAEPAEVILDLIVTNPTCYMFTDGAVVTTVSGGTGGFTVVMTNSAGAQMNFGGGLEINSLGMGWYYVNVTDNSGCFKEDSAFVDNPGQLNIDLILTESLCYSNGNGSAIVDTIYNFMGNYNSIAYFWNPNPDGLNGIGQDTCEHLGGGNYTLTINDQSGCSQSIDFTIISPPELYFDIIGSEASSGGTDGIVYASAAGGTPGYTYTWTNLTTLATSNNTTWGGLLPGDYEIVVVDSYGCTLTEIVTIGYLGTEENFSMLFQIYPSVIHDDLMYVNNLMESNVSLVIYNLQGEIVLEIIVEQGKNNQTLNLESGTYFYRVMDNQVKTEKPIQGKIVIVN